MKQSKIEWIGPVLESWNINTAFQVFTQVKNKNEGLVEQNLLSLSYGKIKRKSIETVGGLLPESFDGYNIIEKDDIVLRLTDLQNDQKSLRVGLSPERGIVTSAYLTLRNRSASLPKYLYYYLYAFDISKGFYGMGAGVRQGLNWDGVKWLKILSPSVSEQEKIIAFLDVKCAQIDAVIEKTRASIEEYKKLKQSIITEAVTKGIRPGRKMKDSGIEWMGEIPEEWEMVRLKYLTTDIVDCPHETPEYSEDGEYLVIRTADQDYARLRSDADMFRLNYTQYNNRTRRMTLNKNDIVYGREGERWGLACLVPESGKYCLGQRMMQFRCDTKEILPLFSMYALSSLHVRRQGEFDTFGSTSPHVNISTIRNYRLPLPPISEQSEICEYINKKVQYIDILVDKKEKEAVELEFYRKSLIFEYVTGKKAVAE